MHKKKKRILTSSQSTKHRMHLLTFWCELMQQGVKPSIFLLFHSSNVGVESTEERHDRVRADVSDTCLRGARDSAPESPANSNIAQALGKKDSLKNMINGEPGVFQKTAWRDEGKQVFLGNREIFPCSTGECGNCKIIPPGGCLLHAKNNVPGGRRTNEMVLKIPRNVDSNRKKTFLWPVSSAGQRWLCKCEAPL